MNFAKQNTLELSIKHLCWLSFKNNHFSEEKIHLGFSVDSFSKDFIYFKTIN